MSGRRIDDHSFWAGSKPHGKVFPENAKTKEEHSADGAGEMMNYPDTTERIKGVQEHGEKLAKKHHQKPGYRY